METTLKTFSQEQILSDGSPQKDPKIPFHKRQRLRQLEGQCKIHSYRSLQFDIIKTILLIIPLIISVVGLLLLKYFKTFRVKCFYKYCRREDAKYAFIESKDGHQQIQKVIYNENNQYVYFKNLKYCFVDDELIPVGYQYEQNFQSISSKPYRQSGLSKNRVDQNRQIFGKNQHQVEIPLYFQYMFDILTKPFFLFQYVICVIIAFERLYLYVGVYLGFSIFTTTINYILLYRSYMKIKAIAEKQIDVIAIRQGKQVTVKNHELVPGDVVIPTKNQEISYDGILISGEVFVNEASLTGESIPVGKFPANDLLQTKSDTSWIVEGAKVLEVREQSRVIVINVGYATRRGRIIRKILTRVPKVPAFFKSALLFLCETLAVGIIIFACTANMMIVNGIIPTFVVFRFLDILAWSYPPSFPIYFNLSYSFSLLRLKWQGVFGTEPQKATEASNIKTFCFDKTGTLTQNEIQIYEVLKLSKTQHFRITDGFDQAQNSLIAKLFATCHTTRETDEGLLGDQVDLRMYLHSNFKMKVQGSKDIRFSVQNQRKERMQVLRINQFQSKFQNMSVLVRDAQDNKYYVFIKGAPQRIDKNSTIKHECFEELVASLSLGGYRTIGYGYKQIKADQINRYIQGEREIFQKDIQALGLVAFQNKLKSDTRSTIQKLVQSDIVPKMITGDNIFIAVETGFRAGILHPQQKILLLQGRKQTNYPNKLDGIILFRQGDEIVQEKAQLSLSQYQKQNQYAIAIDNDFLTLKPEPALSPSIRLFARISPQNKALIVRRFKTQQQSAFAKLSFRERAFGPGRWKVGMCGDGANDLMAIREADLGLGISDSDASYGASFTISKMSDVQLVVRESKNVSQSIIDTIRYFGTTSFLKTITSVILASDVTYFSSNQITYFNFAHSIWLALFLSISSPAQKPSKKRPICNLMSFQNHIIYWSNIIFPTIGFFGAYYYIYTTSLYQSNQNPSPLVTMASGYTGLKCYTNTVVWLLINIPFVCNLFTIYRSQPYKCKLYKNIPLFILTLLNIILAILFFFITSKLGKAFGLIDLPAYESGITLLIMGVTCIGCYLFNEIFKYIYEK